MAQALFDGHPIEQYLRESGEILELMPGGIDEFSRDPTYDPHHIPLLHHWIPRLIRPLFHAALYFLESTGLRSSSLASEFTERFKYVVISSPLLSSSLAASPVNRAPTPTTPGHFVSSSPRFSSKSLTTTEIPASSTSPFMTFTLACIVPAALVQGYYAAGILILAAVKLLSDQDIPFSLSLNTTQAEDSWAMTLESLESLISSNNAWDSVVSEAFGLLENQERNLFQSSPPSPPSPSLRISLSSSLHTTQTQCDNVRQLLSALTSPVVLSQLSEMYAPPSPSHMHTSFTYSHPVRTRPMSLAAAPANHRDKSFIHTQSLSGPLDDAYTRVRTSSAPHTFQAQTDKRSTWNGSYMSLAGLAPRRQKRRSNLSAIIHPESLMSPTLPNANAKGSSSMPPTPSQPLLADPLLVVENEDADADADVEDEPFGVAALDLRRKRRSARVSLFDQPSPSSNSSRVPLSSITASRPSSMYGSLLLSPAGSRFTTFSSTSSPSRHSPLSLSNLHLALQGALSSKRFACAHLLALRFSDSDSAQRSDTSEDADGEDESYWEDVRSVIALLTSTLEDASARLADTMRLEEQVSEDDSSSESTSAVPEPSRKPTPPVMQSFAPMPSHLSRFAAHVDAISAALDDAREHLQECVAGLRDPSKTDGGDLSMSTGLDASLQSYERLRRELGLALRECERGRGTLLEIAQRDTGGNRDRSDEDGDEDPSKRNEDRFSSGESDKTLFHSEEHPVELRYSKDIHGENHEFVQEPSVSQGDDASSHLLLTTTSQHLPPPGIEQVFESLSAASQPFSRERSKLTREERIRMAKAQRESNGSSPFALLGSITDGRERRQERETWGPGGEVVQELKDVIWKVGEQRRRMVARSSSPGLHSDSNQAPPS